MGLWSARHGAQDRVLWQEIVETDMLQLGTLRDDNDR